GPTGGGQYRIVRIAAGTRLRKRHGWLKRHERNGCQRGVWQRSRDRWQWRWPQQRPWQCRRDWSVRPAGSFAWRTEATAYRLRLPDFAGGDPLQAQSDLY